MYMRKSSQVMVAAAVALASAASLGGCTRTATSAVGTASTAPTSTSQPGRVTSTIYFVSASGGKKEYLTADDPRVLAVTDVVTRQAAATDDRDASGINFLSEYQYYAAALAARVKKGQESTAEFYQTNQLTTEHVGIFWFEVSFEPSLAKSTVKMTDQFVYSKASPSYYKKAELLPTTVVAQQRIYSLSLVKGKWLITDVEASKEMKQASPGPTLAGP
jgi:hypothetical protein